MKKYLLPKTGNFYKANMHCHTTCSDGKKTPEEVKALYKKLGYSIVAYTDQDVFLRHDELTDDSFLALAHVVCLLLDSHTTFYYTLPYCTSQILQFFVVVFLNKSKVCGNTTL